VARRPSGTTDGGKILDEPRTRRRAGRAPGTNADRSAEPLYHSERWGGIPVPGVDPNGFLFYPDAPGEFEELATAQECAAFARWMREAESASGLRTDEWFAAIAGKRPPDARELLSGEASLTGYQEFCLQLAIYLGLCPYPKEIMPALLKLVWGLRMHLTQLIPERIRGGGRAASTPPTLRPGGVVPPFEPPGLPEGPLNREALQEGLARARAAAAERMRLLAAVPGADTARELQALAEWLYRHEAVLRAMAPMSLPLTQEEIQQAFAANLVRLRTAAGLTQGQLAERSGVSQPQISQLERAGQEPRLSTVLSLSRALGVDPGALLQGTVPTGVRAPIEVLPGS
jgi:DNA-binding XRE family transcriptional regulator